MPIQETNSSEFATVVIDSNFDIFYPMLCLFEDSPDPQLYLSKDASDDGAENLASLVDGLYCSFMALEQVFEP